MNQREKLYLYESILHSINTYSAITMNHEAMGKLISLVNDWSYAHRAGNGELGEREVKRNIERSLSRIEDFIKGNSNTSHTEE